MSKGVITSAPSSAPHGAIAAATLRALAAPRRVVPIVVVVIPLLAAQGSIRDPATFVIGVALCAACAILAPVTWRGLTGERPSLSAVLVYAMIGAAVVFGIGAVIPRVLHLRGSFLTARTSLAVSTALYWIGGWGLGRDIDLEERLEAQRRRAEALAREAERAQLLALRAHLDPHFLFNTLNAIAEWCRVDGAVAEQAVLRLSDMLRAVLAGVRTEWWSLAEELALVDAVFELHKMRDPARFTLRRDVDPGALATPVPPLVLLPLAENAMKHGPAAGHEGEVVLAIARDVNGLKIALENPGPYAGPRAGSDGLPTVEKRLLLAYEGRARLAITGEGDRTRVLVELPEAAR